MRSTRAPSAEYKSVVADVELLPLPLLPDFGINKKPKPESLKHPEDEAFFAIEESAAHEITIEKQQKWPHKQRHLVILLTEISLAFDWITRSVGY